MTANTDSNDMTRTSYSCAFGLLVAGLFSITFSIALGSGLFALSILFFLVASLVQRRMPTDDIISISAALIILYGTASYFWSVNPEMTLHKLPRLWWIITLIIAANVTYNTKRLTILLKALVAGCVALSIYNIIRNPILAYISVERNDPGCPDFLTAFISKGSMTYSQIIMAGVLISIAFAYINRNDRRGLKIWLILTLIQVVGLIINFKRGAWFCAIFTIMLFAILKLRRRYLLLIVASVVALCMLPCVQLRLSTLKDEFKVEKGGRAMMWLDIAPKLHNTYPSGIGYAALTEKMMKNINPKVEPGRNHLHSNLVNIVVEMGWVGAILYMFMVTAGIWKAFKNSASLKPSDAMASELLFALALVQIGLFLNGLVEYNFGDSEVLLVYCVLTGAAAASQRRVIAHR